MQAGRGVKVYLSAAGPAAGGLPVRSLAGISLCTFLNN